MAFLSTPSVRRATVLLPGARLHHAISIHALREEGDLAKIQKEKQEEVFLSTPSVRRATGQQTANDTPIGDFYPRPP